MVTKGAVLAVVEEEVVLLVEVEFCVVEDSLLQMYTFRCQQ